MSFYETQQNATNLNISVSVTF